MANKPDQVEIETAWQDYRVAMVPKDATRDQLDQLRMSFQGGYISMYLITVRICKHDIPMATCEAMMRLIAQEVDDIVEEHTRRVQAMHRLDAEQN